MKRIISFVFSAALLISSYGIANAGALSELAASSGGAKPAPVPAVSGQKTVSSLIAPGAEWLVLVYIAGMNNLGLYGEAFNNLNQMEKGLFDAGTDASGVRLIVEYGEMAANEQGFSTISEYLRTLLVTPDNDMNKIGSRVMRVSRMADTGDVKTLEKFVRSVKPRFPSKKTALIIWNHGGGIVGIASDDIYGSMMNLKNLSATLKTLTNQFGKFDILATDACLMQMSSIAYEFKDYAKVIIGSEQPIPGAGYPYYGLVRVLAAHGSQLDAKGFGKILVEGYGQQYRSMGNVTLSAVDTSKLPGFVNMLDKWAGLMLEDEESFKIISKANVLKEVARMDSLDSSRDLIHMIHIINRQKGVSENIKEAGRALESYITKDLLVASYASEVNENFGMAIYLPDLEYEMKPYEALKFSTDSKWRLFVRKVLQSRLDNGW